MRLAVIVICAYCACAFAREPASAPTDAPLRPDVLLDGGRVLLPNGWTLSPAGRTPSRGRRGLPDRQAPPG